MWRLPWAHTRDIIISGINRRTKIEIPMFDVSGRIYKIKQTPTELTIYLCGKKAKKFEPPGLENPGIRNGVKRDHTEALRTTDSFPY